MDFFKKIFLIIKNTRKKSSIELDEFAYFLDEYKQEHLDLDVYNKKKEILTLFRHNKITNKSDLDRFFNI